jgi:hypothetical protein
MLLLFPEQADLVIREALVLQQKNGISDIGEIRINGDNLEKVLLGIAIAGLSFAEILLNGAFGFQRLVTYDRAGGFFDGSLCLFQAGFDVVCFDTHYALLVTDFRRAAGTPYSRIDTIQERR